MAKRFTTGYSRLAVGVGGALAACTILAANGGINIAQAVLISAPLAGGLVWAIYRPPRLRQTQNVSAYPSLTTKVLDAFPAPVFLIDGRRRVVKANSTARKLFGRQPEKYDLALTLRQPAILEAATNAIRGEAHHTVEVSLSVPVTRRYEVHAMAVEDTDGTEVRAALVLLDITAARHAEEMRADFVANVSHELRSPLTSLSGFIETLRGPALNDPDAQKRFLDIMEGEAKRMKRLLGDLLSLSRVEANEHIKPDGRVHIPKLLRAIREVLSVQAAKRGVTVEIDCADDLPDVAGNTDELTEVFQNLIDNALKYCAADTVVRISAERIIRIPEIGEAGICISVHNDGNPIPEEHLPRVTERFYRVDKGRSRDLGGTGLGLAIVKHIVKRHRGDLAIASDVQEGTTVSVSLPVAVP